MRATHALASIALAVGALSTSVAHAQSAPNDLTGIRSGAPQSWLYTSPYTQRVFATDYSISSAPSVRVRFYNGGLYSSPICNVPLSSGNFTIASAPILDERIYVVSEPGSPGSAANVRSIYQRPLSFTNTVGAQCLNVNPIEWTKVNMGNITSPCAAEPNVQSVPAVVRAGGQTYVFALGTAARCTTQDPEPLPTLLATVQNSAGGYVGTMPAPQPFLSGTGNPGNPWEVPISAPTAQFHADGIWVFITTQDNWGWPHLRHAFFNIANNSWTPWFDMQTDVVLRSVRSAPTFRVDGNDFWLTYVGYGGFPSDTAVIIRHATYGGSWEPWQTISSAASIGENLSRPSFVSTGSTEHLLLTRYTLSGLTPVPSGNFYGVFRITAPPPRWSNSWWFLYN